MGDVAERDSEQSQVRPKASVFEIGDKAVHPSHGVGEVESIKKKAIAGHEKRFYVLRILETDSMLMVPVDGVERAGLRPVSSKRDATKILKELKKDEIAVTSQPWNRRYREYTDMLNSGSLLEVAKVLRDLSRLRSTKDLSFGERNLLDKARGLLVRELALAKDATEEKISKDLDKILG